MTKKGDSCPACLSPELEMVESVSIDSLAAAWAREACHGEGAGPEIVRSFIYEDLKAEEVEFWACRRCGLEHARPMLSWSAGHYPQEQHGLGFDHEVASRILGGLPRSRVLEIGCADGLFLQRGQSLGHEMVGVDFSAAGTGAARARGLNAYRADVGEIAGLFGGRRRFDVVALFQLIEHLREPDRVFEQIGELARAGTLLVIGCPADLRYTRAFDHPQRVRLSDFWDYPPQHTLRWTPKSLELFLGRHGWQVESTAYEPLSVTGAAAHLVCLRGLAADRRQTRWRRRLETCAWMLRLAGAKHRRRLTGIRLLVTARRGNLRPGPGVLTTRNAGQAGHVAVHG